MLFAFYFEQKVVQETATENRRMLEKSSKVIFIEVYNFFLQTVFQIAVEALANIRTVISLGCEDMFLQMYINDLLPYLKYARIKCHFRGIILALARGLVNFADATGMVYGIKVIIQGDLTYGDMFK